MAEEPDERSTYSMNILQHLPEKKHGLVLVTLNPPFPIDPDKTVGKWSYDHPMMTQQSVATQKYLPEIQNKRNISFAGAWTKYGFHEDGFASALKLVSAAPFNVKPPFPFKPAQRDLAQPGVIESAARLIVLVLENIRRRLEPVMVWVGWVMILVLFWAEQIFGAVRWKRGVNETVRLRECWSQTTEGKKGKPRPRKDRKKLA